MDILSKSRRSYNMSQIKGKDTKPEMLVRRMVHAMGFRYSLHKKQLPGKPDLVFTKLRKIIFVHGCFWHMHNCRYGRVVPKTNADFWKNKRDGNRARDKRVRKDLQDQGWAILVVWECQTRPKRQEWLMERIQRFLVQKVHGIPQNP